MDPFVFSYHVVDFSTTTEIISLMKTNKQIQDQIVKRIIDGKYVLDFSNVYLIFIPLVFLEKLENYIDWKVLSNTVIISEKSIRKFSDKIDFNTIHWRGIFSDNFIIHFQDRINWVRISQTSLSENIIERFKNKVDWIGIVWNSVLTDEFLDRFEYKIHWEHILSSHNQVYSHYVSEYFPSIVNLLTRDLEKFLNRYKNYINWKIVSKDCILTEKIILKFKDYVDWDLILEHQEISDKFKNTLMLIHDNPILEHQEISDKFKNTLMLIHDNPILPVVEVSNNTSIFNWIKNTLFGCF
jgi:hypothetical protein